MNVSDDFFDPIYRSNNDPFLSLFSSNVADFLDFVFWIWDLGFAKIPECVVPTNPGLVYLTPSAYWQGARRLPIWILSFGF